MVHTSSSVRGYPPEAFGVPVQDMGIDPNIELPKSLIYARSIAPALAAVVRYYSAHDEFYGQYVTRREIGSYIYEDAQAIVKRGLDHMHKICASGETLANVLELCKRIRAGSIAPVVPNKTDHFKKALRRCIDSFIAMVFGGWRSRRYRRLVK